MRVDLEKAGRAVAGIVRAVGAFADKKGMAAFLVGGGVRDLLLKRMVKDVDIVVEGDAVRFARELAADRGLPVKTHQQFGTAVISGWSSLCVDFVTARKECYPFPGALPVVSRAGIRDDVFRRDFTINALAVVMNRGDFGTLVDLCGGVEDLKKGRIRVFHENSFLDDPTRILRALRFEQRFGFRLVPGTRRLLVRAVADRVEKTVSAPRYFQEFARGFWEEQPGQYLLRLKAIGALDFLGGDVLIEKGVLRFLDDQCARGEFSKERDPAVVYMAALYAGCSNDMINEQGRIFQWPRSRKKEVQRMIETLQGICPAKGPHQRIEAFRFLLETGNIFKRK